MQSVLCVLDDDLLLAAKNLTSIGYLYGGLVQMPLWANNNNDDDDDNNNNNNNNNNTCIQSV